MTTESAPGFLFSDVIALETRQQEILLGFESSENKYELTNELAEIRTALNSRYIFMDDMNDFRIASRRGYPL